MKKLTGILVVVAVLNFMVFGLAILSLSVFTDISTEVGDTWWVDFRGRISVASLVAVGFLIAATYRKSIWEFILYIVNGE